jgi:hypothetical protein
MKEINQYVKQVHFHSWGIFFFHWVIFLSQNVAFFLLIKKMLKTCAWHAIYAAFTFCYIAISKKLFKKYHSMQGARTGHRSNATLVTGALTITYTKWPQRGPLEVFWGSFDFFCMDGHRGLLIPVRLCLKVLIVHWIYQFLNRNSANGKRLMI